MARTVADCALLENVIAGPDPSDVASIRPKLVIPADLGLAVARPRVALSTDLGCYRVDADVVANTLAAADRLRAAGVIVEEVSLPWRLADIERAAEIHFGMIFGPSIRELYDQYGADLTSYARHLVEDSAKIAKEDLIAGLDLEGRIYAPLGALLEDYDALICPTFAVPALPATYDVGDPVEINGEPTVHWMDAMMTLPFNIASRCPVLSVPVRAVARRRADGPVGRRQDLRRHRRVPGSRRLRGHVPLAGRARPAARAAARIGGLAVVRAHRCLRTADAPGPSRRGRPWQAAGHQAGITDLKETGRCWRKSATMATYLWCGSWE